MTSTLGIRLATGGESRSTRTRPVSHAGGPRVAATQPCRHREEEHPMMTIVTHVTLKEGTEPDWDAVMRERLQTARDRPGWIGGQLMIPLHGPNPRGVIGPLATPPPWGGRAPGSALTPTRPP